MGGSFSTKFKLHTGALNQSENQTLEITRDFCCRFTVKSVKALVTFCEPHRMKNYCTPGIIYSLVVVLSINVSLTAHLNRIGCLLCDFFFCPF